VLVDNTHLRGAPVVYEDNPTYSNLMGRLEHESRFGALITHFALIRAGALHRANGGYLILDALKVLQQPFAWEALKRTMRAGELRVENLGQALGLMPTVSLEPAPIPLRDTKVVLVGSRLLYYLLAALDPDFLELFKVVVDFDEDMDRRSDSQAVYANLVASLVAQEDLRPFDRGAVASVIDHASRIAGDAAKLSVHLRRIVDLLREADYWAGRDGREVATALDVRTAIEAQRYRSGRLKERLQEAIRRRDLFIDTSGERVGQVNGLSVVELGDHMFARPTRITARTRLGGGEVVDIDREVELGGPLHSKGVLILAGFLAGRYVPDTPLSLAATLVFEQSYAPVEGDSASLAELCALLSALAEVPMRQSLAVTGSINQHGQVQAIGAVNEKIEGFFDICRERGLTGEQGVVIPESNVKNLIVRRDVAEAVAAGRFRVCAVEDVDDVVELLTGRPAGLRDAEGRFPDGSINALIEARLSAFAERARAFAARTPSSARAEPTS
jgi:lon-related putative ATP-dependent protease